MKKETIAAISFGILLGVVGAFVMISKAKQIGSGKTSINNSKTNTASSAAKLEIKSLEVKSPTNQSRSNKNSTTIKGKTNKNSLILIQSPIKELAFKNVKEDFSTSFPLALGENIITVTVYPKDPQIPPQQKVLKVYYLDEQ